MGSDGAQWSDDGALILTVRAQPRASKERVMGWHGQQIKIALNAPPVDGAANQALCHFLAKQLGVSKGAAAVISGEKSREKRVRIDGVSTADWETFVQRWGL
ncbi:DUF167 domain-containing protein [Magnetofaba australis]|uniref:UPF0235 protein MAIT1_00967 n=1 Tax=Magnetofaba australis IT-1 TaxID=1434232 RepID=A0A1Y2K003_9PROT|nr:DUF167 domain-containing protein [Magnetofaba australis]OSM00446.1 hypothetical protein MAIT1_00967 [Magnetofaba australis IT-1]